jgi:hypothetical protein
VSLKEIVPDDADKIKVMHFRGCGHLTVYCVRLYRLWVISWMSEEKRETDLHHVTAKIII